MDTLFSPLETGALALPSRIVMAPMTRSRAIGGVPNDVMATYYAQRASAGLIVTEGVAPVPDGLGYARIPGLWSDEQVEGWRRVTDAVHAAGGRIAAQLMHVGRIAHELNLPEGARIVAPSAVTAAGQMYTDEKGPQPHGEPVALDAAAVEEAIDGFVRAARHARQAGFDAIELHAANGYLLEQFLSPHTNRRDDDYGGDIEGRIRFVVETAKRTAAAIGADRVGIRLSPYNTFNDMRLYDDVDSTYVALAKALGEIGLLYVHLVLTPDERAPSTARRVAEAFGGTVILNGGFDRERAEATLAAGDADLVAFGRPFIANPDLVARFRSGDPLAEPDPSTFYSPGPEGYVDYPSAGEAR
ncbi:MAG: alkene reductase [Deltaproteobacteria bacterium]|nr:alkene reductase [Deltaproteobacteria bacterium]